MPRSASAGCAPWIVWRSAATLALRPSAVNFVFRVAVAPCWLMLNTTSGAAPIKNEAAAMVIVTGRRRASRSRGNTQTAATASPISGQINSALSHIPRPQRKNPRASIHFWGSASHFCTASSPPMSRTCCRATGPQSKLLVSRKVVSVASSTVAIAAARTPAIRRTQHHVSQIVNAPSSSMGSRTDHSSGATNWNNPA